MNLPRFFLGLNVGRNTSEGSRGAGSVTSWLVCFIRVWVARLQSQRKIYMMTQNESLGRPENIARNSHGGH